MIPRLDDDSGDEAAEVVHDAPENDERAGDNEEE